MSVYDPVSGTYVADSTSGVGTSSGVQSLMANDSGTLQVQGWLPDTSALDLPGQFDSIPGGGSTNGGVYTSGGHDSLYMDPTVNPNPTGGYMPVLSSVIQAAASGFNTFVKGSPSVA